MGRVMVGERVWPVAVGEAVPGLRCGAERVLLNERLSNGWCNLRVERFGEAVDVEKYRYQVSSARCQVVAGETENEGVFVLHMFWRANGSEVPDGPEVSDG